MLFQTLAQMRGNLQSLCDLKGTTALVRHPVASLNDYINRGIGDLYRKLTEQIPDQRYLANTTITTATGVTTYALPPDFDHCISVDLFADGVKRWLESYMPNERPTLSDPNFSPQGYPLYYRLEGNNITYLPVPAGIYTSTLWYCPTTPTLAADSDAFDTLSRLDDYILGYAGRFVAVRDKRDDLFNLCEQMRSDVIDDIRIAARSRDKNSPQRIVEEHKYDAYGRRLDGIYTRHRRWFG